MAIFLDDEPVELLDAAAVVDLGAVLEAARQQLEPAGRLVVEVRIDGEALDGPQLDEARAEAVHGNEVRLYSADPRALATTALEQVREQLVQTRTLQEEAADLLQQDAVGDGLRKVGEVIEVWLQAPQAVLQAAMIVGVNLDELRVEGQPMSVASEDLITKLKTLKELIGAHDTVGLADTLSYEWPEALDRWDALIAELIRQIEDKSTDKNRGI